MQEKKTPARRFDLGALGANKRQVIIGSIMMLLAAVGLATVLSFVYRGARGIIDNTAEKERIARFLTPVVMFDPVPYDKVEEANPDTLLLTCLWAALLDEEAGNYPQDDMGMVILPGPDVEYQAHRLYGNADLITHRTVDDYENIYMYEADANAYRIPVVAKVTYTPQVDSISKTGDVLTIRVGYVPPGSSFLTGLDRQTTPEPDKYMIYELTKVRNGYNILAIKDDAEGPYRG